MIPVALPFLAAFVVAMLFAPGTIGMLKKRGMGQRISEDGPASHLTKEGTPTMGGLIIIAGILGGVLAYTWAAQSVAITPRSFLANKLLAALLLMAGFAMLGMLDDYLTIHPRGGVRGIASRPKAAIQFLMAAIFVIWLAGQETAILSLGGTGILIGAGYCIFAVFYIVGMANFVNISDGLDGLAAGLAAIAAVAFCLIASLTSPSYEALSTIPLLWAVAGACIAFLWFNANPARVFMGDTGALAVGVMLPVVAVLAHREALLVIVGLVFVLDGLSTALQWAVFKSTRITTGTGRRVFRKSPVHHHFELCGWPEQQVVIRFWIVGALCAIIAYAGAYSGLW
jgi:phospho-N-acetylmuramoyl-pentapeptide-transferase